MTTQIDITLRCLFIIAITLALGACATTKREWVEAQQQGTIAAYEQFLDKYPNAEESRFARYELAKLRAHKDWSSRKSSDTISFYKEFIAKYPGSEEAISARKRVMQLRADQAWQSAQKVNTAEAFEQFLEDYNWDPHQVDEAKKRLASLREAKERGLLSRLQDAITNAKELSTLPIRKSDFAMRILIKASGSVHEYFGKTVQAPGTAYADAGNRRGGILYEPIWQPINKDYFRIIQIGNIPRGLTDIVAYTDDQTIPLSYVVNSTGKLTIIIPRVITPCDLEFQGLLYGRIRLKK